MEKRYYKKNKNRGYMQLRIWQDSIEYYKSTCLIFRKFPNDLRRIVTQQIASVDSIHRNIAEGYCRKSIREYLQFLNYAISSLGESVSGIHTYRNSNQLSVDEFEKFDSIAYKIENGLLKLIEKLEEKREYGNWNDSLMVKESNEYYGM